MSFGYVEKGFSPSTEDLKKINKYTRREFDADSLYVFTVIPVSYTHLRAPRDTR